MQYDNRPIGVFDSGLGGLTVVKEIKRLLPNESILYVGDTARVPYGNRSQETITDFSREIVTFLLQQNVKAIVIACASASSAAASALRKEFSHVPIFDVIQSFKQWHIEKSTSTVAVIGTRATIHAGKLQDAIQHTNEGANLISQACPLFVPIIEEGIVDGPILDEAITLYLDTLAENHPDYLILGCTHYPLITAALQQRLPNTTLVHAGTLLADQLQSLPPHDVSNSVSRYAVTDLNENFQTMINMFMEASITVEKISFDQPA